MLHYALFCNLLYLAKFDIQPKILLNINRIHKISPVIHAGIYTHTYYKTMKFKIDKMTNKMCKSDMPRLEEKNA